MRNGLVLAQNTDTKTRIGKKKNQPKAASSGAPRTPIGPPTNAPSIAAPTSSEPAEIARIVMSVRMVANAKVSNGAEPHSVHRLVLPV